MVDSDPLPTNEYLLVEFVDGILTITLNNPERLNAMNPVMRQGVMSALDRADADDRVRVVVVTGAGRGFCAGADMATGTAAFVPQAESDGPYRDGGGTLVRRIYESTKPIIGAVNGPAAGIGAAMTLAMDFRIASDTSKFGFVYAQRGIGPEGCASWLLPKLVGPATALDWMLTGRVFGAEEALRRGLITEIVAGDALLDRATEIARLICEKTAPLSVSITRQLIWRQLGSESIEDAHVLESRVVPWLAATPDASEGVRSFLEKRAAQFTGRPSESIPGVFPWAEMGSR